MTQLQLALVVLSVAAFNWLLVGWLRNILRDNNVVDNVNERTLHAGVIARGGGLAIAITLVLGLLVMAAVSGRWLALGMLAALVTGWSVLSFYDDKHQLNPAPRLAVQTALAATTIAAFGYIDVIQYSNESYLLLGWLGAPLTLIGVLWLANLYNFMDGMDGLAAAQTIIASVTLAIWLWQFGDQSLAVVCLLLMAASYGFLLHNWHPASIFLGDVGSITIGAFFASLIIIGSHRYQFPVISFVLLFGVFVTDASLTIARRILRREAFWLPHRSHYYQRLAMTGMSHHKIVISAILLMSICAVLATISLIYRDRILLCILLELLLLAAGVFLVRRSERRTPPQIA
ncbi:MAG: glycosyltransferase family 4 protein [Gammaproteobacteria bacterium]|nr:glycosyltransferase family 4 protein [Gammaproteobacteria bacterium]